jgi:NAD(P)-dependent dehydrogenase (short-subunit alcohol dehydrogenase family)
VREFAGGEPDIVVNAAGAFALAPFAATEPGIFERQLAVNLLGPFLVIRGFLPGMLARGSGHIVNIGSVAGRIALPGNAGYGASKFGLRGLHEVLAAELRDTGVRASLVEPAATDTSLWDPLQPDTRNDLPSRADMLRADDVAAAVRFILEQPAAVEVSGVSLRAVLNQDRV